MLKKRMCTLLAVALFECVIGNIALAACTESAVTARLTVENDTVIDNKTGLVWQICLAGQKPMAGKCTGEALEMPWNEADEYAKAKGADWRIPKLEDLETLLDSDEEGGKFPKPFIACESGQIWTASPGFPVNDVAAVLELANGKIWGTGKGAARNFLLVKGSISLDYF